MATMVRKQVYISPEQEERLKRTAAKLKTTEAELIRDALDRCLAEPSFTYRDPEAWRKEREFIRSLIARGPVPGGRTWTREDLYDR